MIYKKILLRQVVVLATIVVGIVSVSPGAHAQSSVPVCASADSDSDGDGWGWENNASCRVGGSSNTVVSAQSNNTSGFPGCSSSAFDPDGDGFGWENNRTCFVVSGGGNVANTPPPVASASPGLTHPVCSTSSADPDGDGFGWENNQTCVVTDASSNSSADSNSGAGNNSANTLPPPPVAAALPGPGTVDGRPVCFTDSTDVNNSGFGFENNRTCVVQSGVTATRSNPLFNRRVCEDWFEIPYGDFRLQNNVWNASAVFSNNWSQCITLRGNASQPVASWDYNWLGRSEGNEFSVKSYPQVYYGRKTSFNQSGSVAETGLPAPLNGLPQFTIDFAFSETGNAERNVAFESFFHYSREAEDNNKQFEMMVWVGKPDIRTPGPLATTARIDGRDWDVHVNPQLGWGYVAFVAQTPFNSGRLNWNAFIDWTRNSGPAFGVPAIVNNTWMGAIELGTETFWGAGTFAIDRLNITRR